MRMWSCFSSLLPPKRREYWDSMGVVASVGSELTRQESEREREIKGGGVGFSQVWKYANAISFRSKSNL